MRKAILTSFINICYGFGESEIERAEEDCLCLFPFAGGEVRRLLHDQFRGNIDRRFGKHRECRGGSHQSVQLAFGD